MGTSAWALAVTRGHAPRDQNLDDWFAGSSDQRLFGSVDEVAAALLPYAEAGADRLMDHAQPAHRPRLDRADRRTPGAAARALSGLQAPPADPRRRASSRRFDAVRGNTRLASASVWTSRLGRVVVVCPGVAFMDDRGWSIYGAERAQPVAKGGKCNGSENG